MRKKRRTVRLADTAAIVVASLLLGVDMMVRDPQPVVTAAPQGDPALTITLIFMALGLCVTCYGIYHERHVLRAHISHRFEVRMRAIRRGVNYNPGLRRLARMQFGLDQAAQ